MKDQKPLSDLPRELIRATGKTPSYRTIYTAAVDAKFPAEKENGRWHYRPENVPAIAEALGLVTV